MYYWTWSVYTRIYPQVVAREMNRVGKYLFVLLLVWVPNLLINLYQEIIGTGGNSRYDIVIEVCAYSV